MHSNDHVGHDRVVGSVLSLAATGIAAALLALTGLHGSPAAATGSGGPLHCDGGVCLRYDSLVLAEDDVDGDGFTDADENAAGTDPRDPTSHPAVLDVLEMVGAEKLPSFEGGLSEVVVLPETLPDGTKLTDQAGLESLAAALGGLAPSRAEGLGRLGISTELMGELGVTGSDVLSLVAGARTGKDQPSFEARVSGMRLSWIAAGRDGRVMSGVGVDTGKTDDGQETKTVRWFEETDGGTVSITVTFEMCGRNCTGDTSVTVIGGGQDDQCSTGWTGFGCFGRLGETADRAFKVMKEREKQDEANATGPKSPAPAPSQSAAQPSPSETPNTSETPKATETPAADGGYENPDADQTTVVVTRGDVERVVRIVRGSNTTPAQVDADRPALDPAELEDPRVTIMLVDPTYEANTFSTISPVRTGQANTNYGQDGPRLP